MFRAGLRHFSAKVQRRVTVSDTCHLTIDRFLHIMKKTYHASLLHSLSEVRPITRQQYLAELRSYLQFMDTEDRDAVLLEYTEKFDSTEDEAALLASIESPMRVAIALRKSYAPIRVPADVGEPRRQGPASSMEATVGTLAVAEEVSTGTDIPEMGIQAEAEDEFPVEIVPSKEHPAPETEPPLELNLEADDAILEQQVSDMVAAILTEQSQIVKAAAAEEPQETQGEAEQVESEAVLSAEIQEGIQERTANALDTADVQVNENPEVEIRTEEAESPALEIETISIETDVRPEETTGFPMEAEIIRPDPESGLPTDEPEIQVQELDSQVAPQDTAPSGRVMPENDEPQTPERRPGAFVGQTVLAVIGGLLLLLVGAAIVFCGLFLLDVGIRNQETMLADALVLYAAACLCAAGALPVAAAAVRLCARRIIHMKKRYLECLADEEPTKWRNYWKVIVIVTVILAAAAVALLVVALFTGCRFSRAFANVQHMLSIIDWSYYKGLFGR